MHYTERINDKVEVIRMHAKMAYKGREGVASLILNPRYDGGER